MKSQDRLATCHPELIRLFNCVIKHRDCKILCGRRGKAEQDKLYPEYSMVKYPGSKHNRFPSHAVDVVPYFSKEPHIRWENRNAFYHFAGFVLGVSDVLNIPIRWGGNWSGGDIEKQSFDDLVHYEIRKTQTM